MKRIYILIPVSLLVIGLTAYKLIINKAKLDEKNRPAPVAAMRIPVKVWAVKEQILTISIVKTGSLAPFIETKVVSVNSGILQQVRFQLGDKIKKGQLLAITDTRIPELELQKAETNAAKLHNDLTTYSELYAGKAATAEKLNEIKQEYSDAMNQVEQTIKNIADASIKAPVAGIIATKPVEEGVFVNSGTEIATIVDISRAKVQVNLTEAEVYKVEQGQHVQITTDVYPGRVFAGVISFISPQADKTHNYLVEILLIKNDTSVLRSGTFVYVDFSQKSQRPVLLVPRDALLESVKNAQVYVVQKDTVALRSIQTGAQIGDKVEVISGLQPGEEVVIAGQINLKEGTRISISK
jgi:RND family efflux transporter MFP subunit